MARSSDFISSKNNSMGKLRRRKSGEYVAALPVTNTVNNSASQQTFINNSLLNFLNSSTAGNTLPSTIIHTTDGGLTSFFGSSTGGLARFITDSGGRVDISTLTSAGMTSGSIEGAGIYSLGSKELTTGLNNLSTVVSGVIADGGAAGGTGGSLIKVGTGTLTLSGANIYTGNTAVNGGTLLVNGSLGPGPVDVSSGAALGGTGTIGGPVTIQNGGMLTPGVSPVPGTLTMGSLTLNSGSILNYKYGTPNVVNMGINDLVNVMGNLTLAGTLNVTDVGGFGAGVYRVFNYTGSLTNNALNVGSLPSGFNFSVDIAHANQVNLVVSGILPTQFWDGSNTTPGNVVFGRGGNGTWNNITTNTNWTTQDGTQNTAWGNGFAVFAGTAGTVTLGDNIHFTGMQFLTNGYLIQAPGSQSLLAAPNTTILADVGITATISAPIANDSGPAKLTKSGAGTLILAGNNTYTGGTTINGGTLQLGNGGTSGSLVGNIADNASLVFNRSDAVTYGGIVSGSGSLAQSGTGVLTLLGTNTYTGGTFLNAGTIAVAFDDALGDPNGGLTVEREEPIPPQILLPFLDPTVETLTSMFEILFSGANTQRFNLTDRMTQIQRGSTGFVSAVPPAPAPIPTGKEIGKKEVVPAAFVPGPTNRWGVWVNGWGDWVNVNDDNGAKGYDFTTGGVSVGVDYRITDYLAIGIFGTYAHTWTSLNPGDVDVNTGRGGLYATYWNQGFYINGGVYAGHNSYDTSRGELTNTSANGSTSGYEVSTFVDVGYQWQCGNFSVGPVFAAQYTSVHVDGFTEQGSFLPLNIHSDSEESWRTDLGVQASCAWHVGNIIVIPSLWAAWEHEYKYTRLPITFSSAVFPGVSATAFGPQEGHDSAIINAGVGTQWTPRISTYAGYQGQLGRDNYDANGVTGTISFSF
jgi:outer membrane autotransporter protein